MISDSNSTISLDLEQSFSNFEIPTEKKKQLGQCFTGLKTGRLLAALSFKKGYKSTIDPMAGHGDLLESIAERAQLLKASGILLNGIEIDPPAAELCKWRVNACINKYGVKVGRLIDQDAFRTSTLQQFKQQDLVIANPPYVRYQNRTETGDSGATSSPSSSVRANLKEIAKQFAPEREISLWSQIIESYSGVSDLSIPSWILSGLMVAPGGTLALVVPQVWLNRDYARIACYTLLRFFRPKAIIQESGQRWFKDALVPVSLVVADRLSSDEAVIPLCERKPHSNEATIMIEIAPAAASSESHVGASFSGRDPEGRFAKWVFSRAPSKKEGITHSRIPFERQYAEIMAAADGLDWLVQLEAKHKSSTKGASASLSLPWGAVENLPGGLLDNLTTLEASAVSVGQGLRTGCNSFFYVDRVAGAPQNGTVQVQTNEIFGRRTIHVPSNMLRPVLRKQGEVDSTTITGSSLRTRLLDLRGWFLPEDIVCTSRNSDLSERVLPEQLAEHVRVAARSYIHRGEKRTLIPELSAVRTNGIGPGGVIEESLLLTDPSIRMWYMIPDIKARHEGSICIPRIINTGPQLYYNSCPPALVDANFSTIWIENEDMCSRSLFALLNSSWAMFCYEAIGATMGGGALKLEATHLRRLPIPRLKDGQKSKLAERASCLLDNALSQNATNLRIGEIDHIVIQALLGKRANRVETSRIRDSLTEMTQQMRKKRARK